MRHNKKFNHLSRTASHRQAMLANMAISLIMHKRITTTLAKAKALKKYVEPLITKSKDDTTNSRRVVFSYLQNKYAVTELFKEISVKVADRPGGYTRIIKTGFRQGDNAAMCFIDWWTMMRTWLSKLRRRLVRVVPRSLQSRLKRFLRPKLRQQKLRQKHLQAPNNLICYKRKSRPEFRTAFSMSALLICTRGIFLSSGFLADRKGRKRKYVVVKNLYFFIFFVYQILTYLKSFT